MEFSIEPSAAWEMAPEVVTAGLTAGYEFAQCEYIVGGEAPEFSLDAIHISVELAIRSGYRGYEFPIYCDSAKRGVLGFLHKVKATRR